MNVNESGKIIRTAMTMKGDYVQFERSSTIVGCSRSRVVHCEYTSFR